MWQKVIQILYLVILTGVGVIAYYIYKMDIFSSLAVLGQGHVERVDSDTDWDFESLNRILMRSWNDTKNN